jgi:hypothetical protein
VGIGTGSQNKIFRVVGLPPRTTAEVETDAVTIQVVVSTETRTNVALLVMALPNLLRRLFSPTLKTQSSTRPVLLESAMRTAPAFPLDIDPEVVKLKLTATKFEKLIFQDCLYHMSKWMHDDFPEFTW